MPFRRYAYTCLNNELPLRKSIGCYLLNFLRVQSFVLPYRGTGIISRVRSGEGLSIISNAIFSIGRTEIRTEAIVGTETIQSV